MSRIQNLLGLLKLLRASDGELETRIRVQKEAFLIGLKFPELFDVRDFEYHHFGPYSRSLSEALQFAVSSKLVDEIDESPSDGSFTKYRYRLTSEGQSTIDEVSIISNDLCSFSQSLKDRDWRTLELASTVRFLEINEFLDRDSALKKALDLKPQTNHREKEALELLAGI